MFNFFKKKKMKHILLVEDDADVIKLLLAILKNPYITVYVSNTGVDAVNIFKTKKIDLALVDYKLPYKNGILLTNEMKSIKDIPIILETGEQMLYANPDTLKDFQFDDVISKPFRREDVLEVVNKYL
jgi:CheY-like chemotaxis protein